MLPGIGCSSPFLTALQMSSQLSNLELAYLLSEFMGLYSLAPHKGEKILFERKPFLNKSEMLQQLENARGIKGIHRVAKATRISCENAASPMEVKLYHECTFCAKRYNYNFNAAFVQLPTFLKYFALLDKNFQYKNYNS